MSDGPDLGKKLGPLPAGVWAVIIVAGLGLGFLVNKRTAANAANQPVQLTEKGVGLGGSGFDVVTPSTPVGDAPITTNAIWGKRATDWLIANSSDPGVADNAIRKYLYSQDLTVLEQSMANLAITHFGAPPEPLAPVTVPTTGGGGSAPPTPTNVRVTGKTATSIALSWDASPGAVDYELTASSSLGPSARVPIVSGTSYNWFPLTSGKVVTLTVKARNSHGSSAPATVVSQTDSR